MHQGRSGLVDLDVRRVIGEAALVAAVLEADEALLAPVDVPRVAHLGVGQSVGGGVTGWSMDGSGLRATTRARGNGGGWGDCLALTFQYGVDASVLMPTAWTQWSSCFGQLVMMPPLYVCHLFASTQMESGPLVVTYPAIADSVSLPSLMVW